MTAERKLQQEEDELAAPDDAICAEADADAMAGEGGMECLRTAADEQLRRNASKIASALAEKAACGDLNATKFLFLVTKEKPRPARWRRRSGPSEAQRLAAEPEWQEPSPGAPEMAMPEVDAPSIDALDIDPLNTDPPITDAPEVDAPEVPVYGSAHLET